ncbi:Asp-tRNA(Asn)/Glu-tRNA(Gln) amidotransferase subunit GatC [Candidatus Kaiserbacteria bacterium]|nr:MAG: Asp-tRNA(Asn)/Glu-tRNA(Gln) amidotransferase subunit GatC [Candidatus Kaiserbacteria bacterium]
MVEVDIAKLANLTRLAISDNEINELEREIPEILAFVEQISEAGGEITKETGDHYNVMREDENPHETGVHTKKMVDAMPDSKDGYLRVRKIIAQD